MKAIILSFFSSLIVTGASAQWTTSGINIYNSNTGVVGIGTGTTFSSFKFEVVGNGQILRNTTATAATSLRLYNNLNSSVRSLQFDYSGSSYSGAVLSGGPSGEAASITTTGAYPLLFGTGNSLRMMINSSGNVGIGTNSPGTKFEVNGGIVRLTTNTYGFLQIGAYNNTDNFGYVSAAGQSNGTGLKFQTTNGPSSASAADQMIITNAGTVGIGTMSPNATYRLDVSGSINASALFVNGSAITGSQWTTTGTNVSFGLAGNVGIGSSNPDAKLTVNGTVHAKEVKVDLSVPGPDYVFDKEYNLLSLEDVRNYIATHNHLPEVPSASEMEKNGVNVSEMNMILLKKVEELTLYIMELEGKPPVNYIL